MDALATVRERANIDTKWFEQQLERAGRNQSDLARHLNLHRSAVSRLLKGERKMQTDEVNAIASFLNLPAPVVLKHAGVAVDLDGQPTRILLAAIINAKGEVERLDEPRPLPQSVIDAAQAAIQKHGNGQIIAAQIRALEGPLAIWDDWIVLFKHTDSVDMNAIGSTAICRSYSGEQIMGKIERARKTGEARVVTVDGETREFDLHTATKVLALIP